MKPLSEEIIALIERHVAGLLDGTEKEQLARALSESPEARRLYLESMDLNASLYWSSQSKSASTMAEIEKSSTRSQDSDVRGRDEAALSPLIPLPTSEMLTDSPLTTPHSTFSSWIPMIGVFAVGIVLTVGVYQASKSDVIHVNSGSKNLILSKVGNVMIHGPAELEMLGPYRVRLMYGQIKVNVSEEDAKGKFVVETPDGNITDLGTEYVLNVSPGSKSSVSVLTGQVNLQVAQESLPIDETPNELLNQGDGVTFRKGFETERLMSIVSDEDQNTKSLLPNSPARRSTIKDVSDNLQKSDTKKFYQIVPQGMKNNVSAYIDRTKYLWIGSKSDKNIPPYLIGGDYVRTFNQDKINSDLALKITLNEPCDLYVLFDSNLQLPDWLLRDFTRCDELIAASLSDVTVKRKRNNRVTTQSGSRVYDLYTIWKRTVPEPGTVELGSNFARGAINFKSNDIQDAAMYGIVAVPLKRRESDSPLPTADKNQKIEKPVSEKR